MTGTERKTIAQLAGVSKSFGGFVAIDNLDLTIQAGEFVTFLGPSGCGKSTTMRIIGGFERPTQGRVLLDGTDVTALPPNKRDVNMVFQDYALFPHMSVARNVAFGLELKGKRKSEIEARVTELLDFLQLAAFRDRRPDQLSGGQRQRVALARALAPDPKILLLDEPLGALDAKLRGQVQIELKSIQQRTGKTFLFVTHDQEEALTMADRIVVMNGGRVEQDGSPEDLYMRPRNRFVAEFLGETNLIVGDVLGVEGNRLKLSWQGETLGGHFYGKAPSKGSNVCASLRPESVKLYASAPPNAGALRGQIRHSRFKGSHTAVEIAVGNTLMKAHLQPDLLGQIDNGQIWVGWDSGNLAVLS